MSTKWKMRLEEERKKKEENLNLFLQKMSHFPCTFNLGSASLDIPNQPYKGEPLSPPDLSKDKWEMLKDKLNEDEDDSLVEIVWKENLLTRVYFELGEREKANGLNDKVLKECRQQNLTAMANSAFLHFENEDIKNAFKDIKLLEVKKEANEFANMKIDAICEQAYAYKEFGGADYLLESLKLLEVISPWRSNDDKVEFMKALIYRRCTRHQIFTMRPDAIDQHEFCQVAATSLYKIQSVTSSKAVKSAALVELAFLKHSDDVIHNGQFKKDEPMLSEQNWKDIVGPVTWKDLVEKALAVEETPSSKVLKIAGQLFRYSYEYERAEKLLLQSISIKPTTRAYHHLGLIHRKKAIDYERQHGQQKSGRRDEEKSALSEMSSLRRNLPNLPTETTETSMRLKFIAKVPLDKILPFTAENPFTEKAVFHLKKAVEISHNQNTAAMYDLATMLAQMSHFSDSVRMCKLIVDNPHPIFHLINAYELCGMVHAQMSMNALEESERQYHIKESEDMFTQAVHFASYLAADVPELSTCTTDIWDAFAKLRKKFTFEGNNESKKKLFKLCELIANHRHLQILDEILSKDEAEWSNKDTLEAGLKRYINLKNYKGAMLFLDMVPFRSQTKDLLTWENSSKVRKIKLEFAKMILCEGLKTVDPVWKTIFKAKFGEWSKFNIVIVDDHHDYFDTSDDGPEKLSSFLKEILVKKCGLNVIRAHEGLRVGMSFELTSRIDTVMHSQAAIFVWNYTTDSSRAQVEQRSKKAGSNATVVADSQQNPCSLNSPSPSQVEVGNVMDEEGRSFQDKAAVNDSAQRKEQLEFMINTCVATHVEDKKPKHLITVVLGTGNKVPDILKSYEVVTLSDQNMEDLSEFAAGHESPAGVDCFMKVFSSLVRVDGDTE